MKYKLDNYNITKVYSTGRWVSMPRFGYQSEEEGWTDSSAARYVKGKFPHNDDRDSCRLEITLLYPTLEDL